MGYEASRSCISKRDSAKVRCEPSPRLPFAEQTAIVRFLDHADRRIRRYIRAKQKLIALLEEQKQAIIHQAVTGQIDIRTGRPCPAYKPFRVWSGWGRCQSIGKCGEANMCLYHATSWLDPTIFSFQQPRPTV